MEGTKALAFPVNKGQSLKVQEEETKGLPILNWTAWKTDGLWFQAQFRLPGLTVIQTSDADLATNLQKLLSECQKMAPDFLDGSQSFKAETKLEFNSEFGFGSSSTLVSNLAYWSEIDPFTLQQTVLGGSGYDIACARSKGPLFYQLMNKMPVVDKVELNFTFSENIYFVYLGHKQRTSESIEVFKQRAHFDNQQLQQISDISIAISKCNKLDEFEKLLEEHEAVLSSILEITPVKRRLFSDHRGVVKSLGAWGGDFVLMTSTLTETEFKLYLNKIGFDTFFTWEKLILK
ncbi:MAG: GHMP kinase [Bacteroidales bacterium]|nr:GHMP kinase [Bacteroidales bacterium]